MRRSYFMKRFGSLLLARIARRDVVNALSEAVTVCFALRPIYIARWLADVGDVQCQPTPADRDSEELTFHADGGIALAPVVASHIRAAYQY